MAEVLRSPSSSSSPSISNPTMCNSDQLYTEGVSEGNYDEQVRDNERRNQLSLLALLVTLFRKGFWVACKPNSREISGGGGMDISWPRDVQHVNHVTFDRFNGFLGLPVEFEPEVPVRAPSASATVFGVSTQSMQLSYDLRGNIIPTILLLMQRHLYSQGGLQAEGIFRITAGNSQDEFVRDQLNRGVVPEGTDVHCLAGLIKTWFRELPIGLLDTLSAEQVLQCQSEEDCDALVRLLPPTEAALLDWAINLMADVVQHRHLNKMNARNVAMVFAPNMTQMADPLTALMHAVQVMNFLKTLIEKNLRERKGGITDSSCVPPNMEPSDDDGNQSCWRLHHPAEEDPVSDTDNITDEDYPTHSSFTEESDESLEKTRGKIELRKLNMKSDSQKDAAAIKIDENKSRGTSNLRRVNSMTECVRSLALNEDRVAEEDPVSDTDNITDEDYPTHSSFTFTEESDESLERTRGKTELRKLNMKSDGQKNAAAIKIDENKSRGTSNLSRVNSMTEWVRSLALKEDRVDH